LTLALYILHSLTLALYILHSTAAMGETLDRGMVLVMSLWDDSAVNMLWLDSDFPADRPASAPGVSRGPCATTSGKPDELMKDSPDSNVKYSNIKYGSIGSTFHAGPTPPPAPEPPTPPAPAGSCTFLHATRPPPPPPPPSSAQPCRRPPAPVSLFSFFACLAPAIEHSHFSPLFNFVRVLLHAGACTACGYSCDANCNCGRCNTKPGCDSQTQCLGPCNSGGNAKWCGGGSTPTPAPATPTPAPPGPAPGCPGGSLSACIGLCPSNPPVAYKACVDDCVKRCS
jgi:hypothetical protein